MAATGVIHGLFWTLRARRLYRMLVLWSLGLYALWTLVLADWIALPRPRQTLSHTGGAHTSPSSDQLYYYLGCSGDDRLETNSKTSESDQEGLVLDMEFSDSQLLDPQLAETVKLASQKAHFQANGFKYCTMLNKAWFDGSVYIKPLGGSLAQTNPDLSVFLNLIDFRAAQVEKGLYLQHFHGSPKDMKRLACYSTALGQSHFANLTYDKLLVSIDPLTYFEPILPAIQLHLELSPRQKPKFKLAYLVMVHETKGFPHLAKLLETLDDGNAIILVHVDARSRSDPLKERVKEWIAKRRIYSSSTNRGNVHLAKYPFYNIWGHASLVFTQLSGFWELLDMADWDYVVNLSNYDWPLKSNAEIHRLLSHDKYKGKNFIEWWNQTDDMTERLYRPHMHEMDHSSIFHIQDTGVTNWPYPKWLAVKHHQWMIITPEFVKFLKHDLDALNFLAFAEHSYIPDEFYFGTVLLNSPTMKQTAINSNKRYLRFAGDAAHPSWLGWKDRFIFPAGEPDPSFYYIRKVNVYGDVFEEQRLLSWINKTHSQHSDISAKNTTCTMEDASVRLDCLKEWGSKVAANNHIILVPVNEPFIISAANLGCSLKRLGHKNIVFWSLDVSVHSSLLAIDRFSLYLPGFPSITQMVKESDKDYNVFVRAKSEVVSRLLSVGFHVTIMDADSIVVKDFYSSLSPSVDLSVGTLLSSSQSNFLESTSSFIHFRNSPHSKNLLEEVQILSHEYKTKSFEWLLKRSIQIFSQKLNFSELIVPYGFQSDIKPGSSNAFGTTNGLRVALLHPHWFFDGSDLFLKNASLIRSSDLYWNTLQVLHTPRLKDPVTTLKSVGLWLVDEDGKCDSRFRFLVPSLKPVSDKALSSL